MANVTVPGQTTTPTTFTFSNSVGLVVQQIANALAAAGVVTLPASSATGGTVMNTVPAAVGIIVAPTAPQTVSGFGFVVDQATTAGAVSVSAGTSLITGTVGGSFVGAGAVTIGAVSGNTNIFQTGAGSVLIGGGDGNDLISASGTGTLTGGAGNNQIFANGTSQTILSTGTDTVVMGNGSGSDSVNTSGSQNDLIYGNSGSYGIALYGGNNLENAPSISSAVVTTNTGYVTEAWLASLTQFTLTTTSGTSRPMLTNTVWSAGKFGFDVVTAPSQMVTVVSSSNLNTASTSWPILLTTNSPGSSFHVTDPRSTTNKTYFYRARNGP